MKWIKQGKILCFALWFMMGAGLARGDSQEPAWLGLVVDRQARRVDVAATVVLRESEWVELLACTPGSREHESILTVEATPSHIHLALLTLGLEPGQPLTARQEKGQWVYDDPTGPQIELTILVPQDNAMLQVPAGQWIRHRQGGQTLADARWIFTGSRFASIRGRSVYAADLNGSVVSLVHFGDELIARQTGLTQDTDGQALIANTPAIPPVGTHVTLRLQMLTPTDEPDS